MIREIRNHIREAIRSINGAYIENERPLENPGNVIGTNAEKTFHADINEAVREVQDELGEVMDVTVNLRVYTQGGRNKLDDYDEGFCEALLINSKIMDKAIINNRNYIKGVTSSQVEPSEIDGSQDLYSFESILTFKISYQLGE